MKSGRFRGVRTAIGIAIAGVFFGALVWATLQQTAVTCEVCVAFSGRSACRTSSGADRDQARQMAQSTACAALSGGVTEGMRCQRTLPNSVSCDDGSP
jgi:hypothetical protein